MRNKTFSALYFTFLIFLFLMAISAAHCSISKSNKKEGVVKPYLQFSIPCLEVREGKGPPSFLKVFYELPFPEFPFTFPEPGFFIANGWCNGKGDYIQSMKILKPDKKTVLIQTRNQPFTLKELETPFMVVNLLAGVKFEVPGTYWVQVFLNNELGIEYPLVVRKAEVKT